MSDVKKKFVYYFNECQVVKILLLCLFFLNVTITQTNGQTIIGSQKQCTVENQKIDIPGITDDPCIRCFCKAGFVKCVKESCTPLSCHVTTKIRGRCCPVCKGCRYNETTYQASNQWTIQQDTCSVFNCKDGVITQAKIKCETSCLTPLAPSVGNCCPFCYGCTVGGVQYEEGDVFSPPGQQCTSCTCRNGNTSCIKKSCPIPACSMRRTRPSADGCCLECVGTRLASKLSGGKCWFQRNTLRHQQELKVDPCTICVCQDGTVICKQQDCPMTKNCGDDKLIHIPDKCCPICPDEHLKDCKLKHRKVRKHGEVWTKPNDVCQQCECDNGTVTCHETVCPVKREVCGPGEIVDVVAGKCCKSCVPVPGVCTVFGDPHYQTFDGRPFNYQGDCKYVLSKDCSDRYFSVVVQNDGKRSRSFSWTKSVFLQLFQFDKMPKTSISLHQRLTVKIDGKKIFLPHRSRYIDIRDVKGYIEVKTVRGVSLRWDGDSYLEVAVSPMHRGTLCGMCGNFNGFARDDFIGGDGSFKRDKNSFAESWKATNNIFDCTRPNYDTTITRPCGNNLYAILNAREKCSIFKSLPFRPCYDSIDPTSYYEACLTDTCECSINQKCSCEPIRAYTQACAREGVQIEWNQRKHCKRTCRRGKVYSTCGPPCKLTCRNFEEKGGSENCLRRPCVAGCHCRAGQVLFRKRCVPISMCLKRKKGGKTVPHSLLKSVKTSKHLYLSGRAEDGT